MRRFGFTAIVVMVLAFSSSAFAQTSKGYFVGNVFNQDGAVIKITDSRTGVTHVTTSNDDGRFGFDAVEPGTYRIEISQAGFKTITRDGLIISANQTTTANFVLEDRKSKPWTYRAFSAPVRFLF